MRRAFAIAAVVLVMVSLAVDVVAAEPRQYSVTDVIFVGAGDGFDVLENIAGDHNDSYGSVSWAEFLNASCNDTSFGPDLTGGNTYAAPAGDLNYTFIQYHTPINTSGVLYRADFYLKRPGFVKIKVFRENSTHFRYVDESRVIYGCNGTNTASLSLRLTVTARPAR